MTTAVATKASPSVSVKKPARVTAPPFDVVTDANGDRFVTITHKSLLEAVRDACRNIEGLWDTTPKVSVADLFEDLPELKSHAQHNKFTALTRLIAFLENEHSAEITRMNTMLENGVISFMALRLLLKPGTEIFISGTHGQGGKISECSYRHSPWGSSLDLEYEFISTNGDKLTTCTANASIGGYRGVCAINQLSVQPISAEQKAALQTRGHTYASMATGAHYKQFTGHMEVVKWWSYTSMRASGRVMVDVATHNQFKEDRHRHNRNYNSVIANDSLWMCEPYLQGFSFVTKQWGRFAVEDISDISFRADAYDQLVLDPEKKTMVRALVEDSSSGFSDIISGKGGGCIFLLHGEPGVGKTLTAEAVSELLHRPLYSVSVGELGVNAQELEKNLRQILDVAQIWNAVILIDEADIFLEKRSTGDILRNACVSVFLRLTEYHQGVMFLTTNRVSEFDTAFYSRISVALKYDNLTVDDRRQIWQNLLMAANMPTSIDVDKLCVYTMNGRMIKNAIRLAHGLANSQKVEVSTAHLEHVIKLSAQFLEDIK